MEQDLREAFLSFVKKESMFSANESILVACSGGVDSMVLCHLLNTADISFEIAHVNYGLRGAASDSDESFVEKYCKNYSIPFHSKRIIDPPQSNIQEWARQVRYEYFNLLVRENNIDIILTGHHFDDQIETFLINFTRGSGLSGLTGIQHRRDNICRPLLFARKSQILEYAMANHLAWREDTSNASDYYVRNKIRHNIAPALEELRNHDKGIRHTLSHLKELNEWLSDHFSNLLKKYKKENGEWQIKLNDYSVKNKRFELLQILRSIGYNANQIDDMLNSRRTGTKYYSESHVAIIDRGILRFRKKITSEFQEISFDDFSTSFAAAIGTTQLHFSKIEGNGIERSYSRSYFDLKNIQWPLKVRKWQIGDRFQPFGMYGKTKKVSDLMTHLKLSHFEKEETLILVDSTDTILWVIGYRRAMASPVTETTEHCLLIEQIKM